MNTAHDVFTIGGTLSADNPSYVPRPSDSELYEQLSSGQYCYILTARQMGKSSLMARTAKRLREDGSHVVMLDLSDMGQQATAEQWYLGFLRILSEQLHLPDDVQGWWAARSALSYVQRFSEFVERVVLPGVGGQIVVVVDEIDTTLGLSFTDDFFAAVRLFYNKRASDPEFRRLVFVLIGVATPSDLIKDRSRTPFNIGQAIQLRELSQQAARPLAAGLDQYFPGQGGAILARIFAWTGGHPYLTQFLCAEVSKDRNRTWDDDAVNALVHQQFFADRGANEHLNTIRDQLRERPDRGRLLQLYSRVYRGEPIAENERSLEQHQLKLIGLVRSDDGRLVVRNRIYRQAFDQRFIKTSQPRNWPLIISCAAVAVIALALVIGVVLLRGQAEERRVARLETVAGLCGVAEAEGRSNFFGTYTLAEQLDMFTADVGLADSYLVAAAACVGPAVATTSTLTPDERGALSGAICAALGRRAGVEAGATRQAMGCS